MYLVRSNLNRMSILRNMFSIEYIQHNRPTISIRHKAITKNYGLLLYTNYGIVLNKCI